MRSTVLQGREDLDWLFEVHLKDYSRFRRKTKLALLFGNEDYPERVDLYSANHIEALFASIVPEK